MNDRSANFSRFHVWVHSYPYFILSLAVQEQLCFSTATTRCPLAQVCTSRRASFSCPAPVWPPFSWSTCTSWAQAPRCRLSPAPCRRAHRRRQRLPILRPQTLSATHGRRSGHRLCRLLCLVLSLKSPDGYASWFGRSLLGFHFSGPTRTSSTSNCRISRFVWNRAHWLKYPSEYRYGTLKCILNTVLVVERLWNGCLENFLPARFSKTMSAWRILVVQYLVCTVLIIWPCVPVVNVFTILDFVCILIYISHKRPSNRSGGGAEVTVVASDDPSSLETAESNSVWLRRDNCSVPNSPTAGGANGESLPMWHYGSVPNEYPSEDWSREALLRDECRRAEWRALARVLDSLFCVLSLCSTALLLIAFLIIGLINMYSDGPCGPAINPPRWKYTL